MKKTEKNSFSPILILAIVIALVGVGYFGYKNLYTRPSTSQTTIDTANWQKYTNIKYHYSIAHPPDTLPVWGKEALSGDETEEEKDPNTTDNMSLGEIRETIVAVTVTKTTKTLTEEEKIANSYDNNLTFFPKTFNNLPAFYANHNGNQYYTLISNGFKYEIVASTKNVPLANQILATFEFTK